MHTTYKHGGVGVGEIDGSRVELLVLHVRIVQHTRARKQRRAQRNNGSHLHVAVRQDKYTWR
jgi:hypothetical protein